MVRKIENGAQNPMGYRKNSTGQPEGNPDTRVSLCGVELDNPIIPASGTFGYGVEFAKLYDINILGTFSMKSATKEPRFGNITPRIAECASGMLNAVGLQNPGLESVLAHELPEIKKVFKKKIMANVSGFSVDEYVTNAAALGDDPQIGWIELNISCPNVKRGGEHFGNSPSDAFTLTREVKQAVQKPIIVKLSPNTGDIAAISAACEEAGADGLSLINTIKGMRIDLKTQKPVLANKTGGLSGPAVFPVALRMVYEVYEAVKLPIVGIGGVSTAEDVIEMMLAGAAAVGVGAANLINPYACRDIIESLPGVMREYGITRLTDIIGGAHN